MKERVGVGIIGVGKWGEKHAKCYSEIESAELVAVADKNEDRAKCIAAKYGASAYYTDYMKLLDNRDIQAVSVVLPDFLHKEAVIGAAKAGKHVYLEKPMATTMEDAEEMLAAASKSGVKMMVGFCNRWNPPFVRAKEALEKGELGNPLYGYARLSSNISLFTQAYDWGSKTTVAWFLMSHTLDLLRWLFGSEATKVYAAAGRAVLQARGIKTPDYFAAIVHFKNGTVGTLESSCILPETRPSLIDFKFELIGTRGCIYTDTRGVGHGVPGTEKYTPTEASYPDVVSDFEKEAISHFVQCILKDKSPAPSGEDGVANTRILCAIHRSAETGEVVKV